MLSQPTNVRSAISVPGGLLNIIPTRSLGPGLDFLHSKFSNSFPPRPHTGTPQKYDTRLLNPIYSYVKARITRGHPISVIDLTDETLDIIPDIKFLDKVAGLTVLWRQHGSAEIQQYICGMSTP